MMTVEDCRRKAAAWLGKAQLASDPKTSASMRRASDAWTVLAQQIEHAAFRRPQSPAPVRRPADLAKPRNTIDRAQVGDVLRGRLHLSDEPSEDSTA
jgi:phosphohistidine phosphatase SixA